MLMAGADMKKRSRRKHIRIVSGLLASALFLTACQGKGGFQEIVHYQTEPEQNDMDIEERIDALIPEKKIRVGFVQVGHESDWRIAATQSCREVFSEENGYDLYFVDADNDPKAQVRAVRWFMEQKMDYIIIDPIIKTGWTSVLTEAYHAKIPVFIIDRTVDMDARYYQAWFGSDFVLEGECAGQWLQKYLVQAGKTAEQIQIVTILGTPGASAQLGRSEGFEEYVSRYRNWNMLAEESGDFTESGGKAVMEKFLQQYPELDVVVCQNDNEAIGACEALEEVGRSYGRDGDVVIISFDATKAGLQAVRDGRINADFECNPMAAEYVEQAIQKMEAGEPITDKFQYLPENGFVGEENGGILWIGNKICRMLPVTEELLDTRNY